MNRRDMLSIILAATGSFAMLARGGPALAYRPLETGDGGDGSGNGKRRRKRRKRHNGGK